MIQSAASGVNAALQNLNALGSKIANPDVTADAGDIVAFKEAAAISEINIAVLKKLVDTSERLVDVIA